MLLLNLSLLCDDLELLLDLELCVLLLLSACSPSSVEIRFIRFEIFFILNELYLCYAKLWLLKYFLTDLMEGENLDNFYNLEFFMLDLLA